MTKEGLVQGLTTNIPYLEEPCGICLLSKEDKISRGPTYDLSNFSPGFML